MNVSVVSSLVYQYTVCEVHMRRITCIAVFMISAILVAGCGGGSGGDGQAGGVKEKKITVNPSPAIVAPGAQKQFTVSVEGLSDDTVVWEVVDGVAGGEVDSEGLYTAPAAVGIYTVKATSKEDSTISGTVSVIVTVSYNYGEVGHLKGTVNIKIDDSVSYDFTLGDSKYRSDYYVKEDVTYSGFLLHGPIELGAGKYYWNSHNGETMNIDGSLETQDDWFRYQTGKIVQTDKRIAAKQSKTIGTYFQVSVDPANMTFEIDFDGVYLDGLKYWQDFESGDYENGTSTSERVISCTATGIPFVISADGYIKGTKSGIPIQIIDDPALFIDATLTWDLQAVKE